MTRHRHHRHRHPARQAAAATSAAAVRLATIEGNVMRRNNLHHRVRLNFRARVYQDMHVQRYGKFFVFSRFCIGHRYRLSNRMTDRFHTDNMKREIYKYSFKHR